MTGPTNERIAHNAENYDDLCAAGFSTGEATALCTDDFETAEALRLVLDRGLSPVVAYRLIDAGDDD